MKAYLSKYVPALLSGIVNGVLAVVILMESLLITSLPLAPHQDRSVTKAIDLLDARGFEREAFVLRNAAVKRSSDNWLNAIFEKENAFAATNMPFGLMTIYPDFFSRTTDDTERAMILLHEARHMLGDGEAEAYGFVWKHRRKLGWTQLSHGSGEVYTTVELQTRAHTPGLFNCPDKLWGDCTEMKIGR